MWGIRFRQGTKNGLIAGEAIFDREHDGKRFRVVFGPHQGMMLFEQVAGDWKPLPDVESIEEILPTRRDCGMDWTLRDFVTAYSFWGEGYGMGEINGKWT